MVSTITWPRSVAISREVPRRTTMLCGGSSAHHMPPSCRPRCAAHFVWPTVFADVEIACGSHRGDLRTVPSDSLQRRGGRIAKATISVRLSSYVWSENLGRAHRWPLPLSECVFVNSQNVRDLRQPSGVQSLGHRPRRRHLCYECFSSPKMVCVVWLHHIPHWVA